MNRYDLLAAWLLLLAAGEFFSGRGSRQSGCCSRDRQLLDVLAVLCVLIPLCLVVSSRTRFVDTGAYIQGYLQSPSSFSGMSAYLAETSKGIGFSFLTLISHVLFQESWRGYLILICLLQAIPLCLLYREYSPAFFLSMFFFVASGDYLSWMMNGIRQFLAVILTFLALPLLLKKRYPAAVCLVGLAATFHSSALIVLPFLFLSPGTFFNRGIRFVFCFLLVCCVFRDPFVNVLESLLADTEYSTVVTDWQSMNDTGSSLLRTAFYSIPGLLALWNRKSIRTWNDPLISLSANMAVMTMALYLLSSCTSGIYIGRLPIYFSLYSYILLPALLERLFAGRLKTILFLGLLGAYCLFYWVQAHLVFGL